MYRGYLPHGKIVRITPLIPYKVEVADCNKTCNSTFIPYTSTCHPPTPALGAIQPPVQWVPGLSRGEKRPERGVDHPHPYSVEVKEIEELYIYSPFVVSWPVIGHGT